MVKKRNANCLMNGLIVLTSWNTLNYLNIITSTLHEKVLESDYNKWFGLLEFNVSFVTVTDICQPEKLIPLLP